ncbi:hypothetical protein V5O48_006119 [Marasmius crinis-equi]|uniref:Uncharacterized protein n=1 Tax=Marasmius crinis-equi TaxID=585013 RepID=A0ABR3FKH5_9AGAR
MSTSDSNTDSDPQHSGIVASGPEPGSEDETNVSTSDSNTDFDPQHTIIVASEPKPGSEDDSDPISVVLTPSLCKSHPSLPSNILDVIKASGEGCAVAVKQYHTESLHSAIFWEGSEGRAGILWLEAAYLHIHINLDTVDRLLQSFQDSFSLSVYSDAYVIIHGRDSLSDADQAPFQATVDAIVTRMQMPVTEDPKNHAQELKNTYARMLLSIPRVDICQTELVMYRCPNARSLCNLLKSVRSEVEAGTLPLNTSLFTRG